MKTLSSKTANIPNFSTHTKKKKLSDTTKNAIVAMRRLGISCKAIANETGASRASVFRVVRSQITPLKKFLKKRGPKPKTTPEMDQFLVDCCEENRKLTPRELQKKLLEKFHVKLSLSRIRFRLQLAGLHGHVCTRKPLLSMVNKLKRLQWAYRHRNWTVEQWKTVLWTDEKKFELFNSKRRTYCRRRKGEPLRDDTIQGTVKHGGGSAMFWGCFGGVQVGDIHQVIGIMKKEDYKSILIRHALPSGCRLFGKSWILQQDNDPKHSSNLCKDYLRRKASPGGMQLMEWPPQSPDLSPIELLWDEVDRQVQEKRPSSVGALTRIVKKTWGEIAEDILDKLLARMPALCRAVLEAKGGYFDEKLRHLKKTFVYH